ncbi:MAG: hypothetical protein M3Q45_11465 [Chloroflexota bacterium]|nr:hypothetical protein [Chloroflexota bacterium]
MLNHRWLMRYLLPLAGLITLGGYGGSWVNHRVAGLVVTGLDLGEYVKFLLPVRNGQLALWREGFYLPLVTVSLAFSLHAFRARFAYSWLLRALMLAAATVAALNLLPPAWTPPLLLTPEFRSQTMVMALCLVAVGVSPFLALLPQSVVSGFIFGLSGLALWFPIRNFLRVLPTIRTLYNQPLQPGWGLYSMAIGLVLLAGASIWISLDARKKQRIYPQITQIFQLFNLCNLCNLWSSF